MKRFAFLFAAATVLLSKPVVAQTLVNANSGVAFTASSAHNTTIGGVPVLDHYDLTVTAQNNLGAIVFTIGLGKPTPDASNTITVQPITQFATIPANQIYVAVVTAVGNGGTGTSAPSDPFARLGPPDAPGKPVVKQ